MTSMLNLYDIFMTALLKPFVRVREQRMKLQHTIEMDKQAAHERHIETILEGQRELVKEIATIAQGSTTVLKEWLDGFHKIPQNMPTKAPPVNDDERMWELEMKSLAEQRGVEVPEQMSAFDLEQFISSTLKDM